LEFSRAYNLLPVTQSASRVMSESPKEKDLKPFLDQLGTSELYPVGETSWAAVNAEIKKRIGKAVAPAGSPSVVLGGLQATATRVASGRSRAAGCRRQGLPCGTWTRSTRRRRPGSAGASATSSRWSAAASPAPARRSARYASAWAWPPCATTSCSTPSSTTPAPWPTTRSRSTASAASAKRAARNAERRADAGGAARRPSGHAGGQGGEEGDQAPGAVDDDVRAVAELGDLVAAAAHQQAGDTVGAELLHGREGREVAEVVARVEDRPGADLARVLLQGDALVHAGRAQLQHHPARLHDQAVPGGQAGQRLPQGLEGGLRLGGPAGVHGHRAALLLDPGASPGAAPVQRPGQLGPHGGVPGGGFGGGDGAGDGVPALRAVVAEHDQVLQAGDAREAAVADRDPGRPARDHGDGGHLRGERGQRGHGAGMRPGPVRVGHDRRERAVEVEADQRPVRAGEEGVEPFASGPGDGR